jgi:hypothetical protein
MPTPKTNPVAQVLDDADEQDNSSQDTSQQQPSSPAPAQAPTGIDALLASRMTGNPAVSAAYQNYLSQMDKLQQQYAAQNQMSPLEQASALFQVAGALGQPTRTGSIFESLANASNAASGPLAQMAKSERDRQEKLLALQQARAKMQLDAATAGQPSTADLMAYAKYLQDKQPDQENFKAQLIAPGKYALVGDQGTVKPIDQNALRAAGATAATDTSQLSGEDFLKTQPADVQQLVKAWSNGDLAVPAPGSLASMRGSVPQALEALQQYDPTGYNNIINGVRVKTAKGFSPDGTEGKTMGFAGKALDHLDQFRDLANKMKNSSLPMYNSIANKAEQMTGGSNYTAAQQQREYVMSELSKFLKGGTPAEAEIRRNLESIDLNGSPEQIQKGIDTVKTLILGQVDPLVDQYNTTMGQKFQDGRDYLAQKIPTASRALSSLDNNPLVGSDRYKSLQRQKALQQPSQTPQTPSQSTQAPQTAPRPDAQGWITLPNGVRIRQKPSDQQ